MQAERPHQDGKIEPAEGSPPASAELGDARRPLILIIDGEPGIHRFLTIELQVEGFGVTSAFDGTTAISILASGVDAVVLDVDLPDISGLDLLRRIKSESTVPVVILTAATDEETRRRAFELDADDVVGKPFSPSHVSSTLKSMLSPTGGKPADRVYQAGKASIDLRRREVRVGESAVLLSRSEWLLLESLIENRGSPRLNQELLTAVWGSPYRNDNVYLALWIKRLAHKLGDDQPGPKAIHRYRDVGYFLDAR